VVKQTSHVVKISLLSYNLNNHSLESRIENTEITGGDLMKLINMPKGLEELNLPEKAYLMFVDIFFAFFEMGYIESNDDIASKYSISIRTVSDL
jgi:hypothetical protein